MGTSNKQKDWSKAWKDKNKEKLKEYNKAYYQKTKANRKKYYTDGHYSVYLLPNENYVGQTQGIKYRMYRHKSLGTDTSDYKILHTFSTREEALAKEKEYHDKGYRGYNSGK